MFNNSDNMGLPLAILTFGDKALAPAIILFLVENTLHFSVGMKIINPFYSLINILKTPMIATTLLGLAISFRQTSLPMLNKSIVC